MGCSLNAFFDSSYQAEVDFKSTYGREMSSLNIVFFGKFSDAGKNFIIILFGPPTQLEFMGNPHAIKVPSPKKLLP